MPESEFKLTLEEFRNQYGDGTGYVEYVSPRCTRHPQQEGSQLT